MISYKLVVIEDRHGEVLGLTEDNQIALEFIKNLDTNKTFKFVYVNDEEDFNKYVNEHEDKILIKVNGKIMTQKEYKIERYLFKEEFSRVKEAVCTIHHMLTTYKLSEYDEESMKNILSYMIQFLEGDRLQRCLETEKEEKLDQKQMDELFILLGLDK